MKRFYFALLLVSAIISVLTNGCKKETHPDTVPDYEKANLTGTVMLYGQSNNAESPQKMFVVAEGNSFATYAETDKEGAFVLRNVPFYDNYTLSYIKDGYGTYKIYNFNHQFTGSEGKVGATPKLGMKSTTSVKSLLIVNDTTVQDTVVQFNVNVSASNVSGTNPAYVRFLFHEINSVSDSTFTNYSPRIPISSNPAEIVFTKADFQEMGMQNGSAYFVRAYGESFYTNEYFDFVKSKEVFPNLCTTNSPTAVEFVVP